MVVHVVQGTPIGFGSQSEPEQCQVSCAPEPWRTQELTLTDLDSRMGVDVRRYIDKARQTRFIGASAASPTLVVKTKNCLSRFIHYVPRSRRAPVYIKGSP